MKATDQEAAALAARAEDLGVSIPRLMVDAAFNYGTQTTVERKAAIAELFQLRRLLANAANNLNQLARFANTEGSFPADAEAALLEYRELVPRIKEAVSELAGS